MWVVALAYFHATSFKSMVKYSASSLKKVLNTSTSFHHFLKKGLTFVKIELSIRKLITIIISILLGGGLIGNLIWDYPITEGSKWLWQFIPSFMMDFYVFCLSQLLLTDFHNFAFSILIMLAVILAQVLSPLVLIMKTLFDIKKTQDTLSPSILTSETDKEKISVLRTRIKDALIQLVVPTIFTSVLFVLLFWVGSFFVWQNLFESNIIILSSKQSYTKINNYKMKWFTMRSKKEFFELMDIMNKDVKNVQTELKKI